MDSVQYQTIKRCSIASFNFLLKTIVQNPHEKLSRENRLLLFLIRMKLGISFAALGVLFHVHRTTDSRNFDYIVSHLAQAHRNLFFWPSKLSVMATMPNVFKESFENCRVIIDCTEFKVEQAPNVKERVHLYSHYKKGFTIKILVGCTPSGFISW